MKCYHEGLHKQIHIALKKNLKKDFKILKEYISFEGAIMNIYI